jgi:hypothetical protein
MDSAFQAAGDRNLSMSRTLPWSVAQCGEQLRTCSCWYSISKFSSLRVEAARAGR